MNILVTGASGFVGKVLVKKLIDKGNNVSCLVHNKRPKELDGCKLFYGNINNKKIIEKATKNQEIVFHLVGIGNVSTISRKDYLLYRKINVHGTKILLDACLKNKVKKIIYLSSTAAMGPQKGIINENSICKPETAYQKSKFESEELIKQYVKQHNLNIVILRPSMIYGPSSKHLLIIHKLIKKGFVPLINGAKAIIPLVYVDDVADAAILASKYGKKGSVYIITNDEKNKLKEIVVCIKKITGKKALLINIPKSIIKPLIFIIENISKILKITPQFTVKRVESMTTSRVFDITKARKELKWSPKINMEEGIKNTLKTQLKKEYQ